jgi:hypothetical protein
MDKNYLFIIGIGCILCFSSCTKENENAFPSALSVKAVSSKADAGSSDTKDVNTRSSNTETGRAENDTVLWCNGSDIEWYNATTGELRMKHTLEFPYLKGKFVIFLHDKELLSLLYVSPYSSASHVCPCITYYGWEEIEQASSGQPQGTQVDRVVEPGEYRESVKLSRPRYYICESYPVFSKGFRENNKWDWAAIDALIEKNRKAIEPEWNLFIEQLKKEGKYRE